MLSLQQPLIVFFSRAMGERFRSKSTFERELNAMVLSNQRYQYYLIGPRLKVFPDHISLRNCMKQNINTQRSKSGP